MGSSDGRVGEVVGHGGGCFGFVAWLLAPGTRGGKSLVCLGRVSISLLETQHGLVHEEHGFCDYLQEFGHVHGRGFVLLSDGLLIIGEGKLDHRDLPLNDVVHFFVVCAHLGQLQ